MICFDVVGDVHDCHHVLDLCVNFDAFRDRRGCGGLTSSRLRIPLAL